MNSTMLPPLSFSLSTVEVSKQRNHIKMAPCRRSTTYQNNSLCCKIYFLTSLRQSRGSSSCDVLMTVKKWCFKPFIYSWVDNFRARLIRELQSCQWKFIHLLSRQRTLIVRIRKVTLFLVPLQIYLGLQSPSDDARDKISHCMLCKNRALTKKFTAFKVSVQIRVVFFTYRELRICMY
jgi:hypothetical protein